MEKKPYSDRRWWETPKAFDSECSSCEKYRGYMKCDRYPDGIPKNLLKQSFTGSQIYKKGYCSELKKKQ